MSFNKTIRYYLPAIIWAVIILVMTSIPDIDLPDTGFDAQDKLAHFGVYLILAFLASRALWRGRLLKKRNAIFFSIIYCSLLAIFDELHQGVIPGRYPDVIDGAADILGVLFAQFLFFIYCIYLTKTRPPKPTYLSEIELEKIEIEHD